MLSKWSKWIWFGRPHPKWWFSKGNSLISGKPRLVKYNNLARSVIRYIFVCLRCVFLTDSTMVNHHQWPNHHVGAYFLLFSPSIEGAKSKEYLARLRWDVTCPYRFHGQYLGGAIWSAPTKKNCWLTRWDIGRKNEARFAADANCKPSKTVSCIGRSWWNLQWKYW